MNRLFPQNWSPQCWVTFLVWLAFAVIANSPYSSTVPTDDSLKSVAAYGGFGIDRPIGWPLTFGSLLYSYGTHVTWIFWPIRIIANLTLIALVQLSILAVFQYPTIRFSLRVFLIALSFISVSVITGYRWLDFELYWLWPPIYYTYFLPVIVLTAGTPDLRRRLRAKMEDNNTMHAKPDLRVF